MLCHEARSAAYVPVTGSPAVVTATFCSVPPVAVTVIPCDGSAPAALFPGVIVTTGPAGDGFANGDADAEVDADAAPDRAGDAAAAGCNVAVPGDPVQAVTVNASAAAAATAESGQIALMSTRYATTAQGDTVSLSVTT